MRRLRTLLLVPALLALLVGGAAAQGAAPRPGLDPSFGSGGIAAVEASKEDRGIAGFTVAADGRIYVLAGSLLLAFESDGAPAAGFGFGGRVAVASSLDESFTTSFAIDSQGRLLVAGSGQVPSPSIATLFQTKPVEAYLIRLLPDGSRDPSFGNDGEVDTDFGLPANPGEVRNVSAGSIIVDAQDRPVVGGAFGPERTCSYATEGGRAPYIARLTTTGAPDPTFVGTGYATLEGTGGVGGLVTTRGGNFAVFSYACPTPPHYESRGPEYSVFTEGGEATSIARQVPIGFDYAPPLIDPVGRVVELEGPPPAGEGVDSVARYLADGDPDPSFGSHGRSILRHKPHYADAIAVDAHSRPIIALEAKGIVLRRYLPNGKVDIHFGPRGRLQAKGKAPSGIALDAQGRIYTVGVSKGSAAATVTIARFIPGR